jgi:hypothetical protein
MFRFQMPVAEVPAGARIVVGLAGLTAAVYGCLLTLELIFWIALGPREFAGMAPGAGLTTGWGWALTVWCLLTGPAILVTGMSVSRFVERTRRALAVLLAAQVFLYIFLLLARLPGGIPVAWPLFAALAAAAVALWMPGVRRWFS